MDPRGRTTTEGALLPVLVDKALRLVEKRHPDEGRVIRKHLERLMTGEVQGVNRLHVFPSTRRFIAEAAVRETTISAGETRDQRCQRQGCTAGVLVLHVGGVPVALFNECSVHAREEPQPRRTY